MGILNIEELEEREYPGNAIDTLTTAFYTARKELSLLYFIW